MEDQQILEKYADVLANLPARFQFISLLGEGGMGVVFKVLDEQTQKICAVKILRPQLISDESALARFKREADMAARLKSPHIAGIHDFGFGLNGAPYLVMECIEGQNLEQLLKRAKKLSIESSIQIFYQLARALQYAHSQGVIHRDIKPSNIIIKQLADSAVPMAVLVDFGIAKNTLAAAGMTAGLTHTGEIFGTPTYMAPEQCQGNEPDKSSDVYALGCVMYEVICGHAPFQEENPIKLILQHVSLAPLPLRQIADLHIPRNVNKLVMRCLEKDKLARYDNMAELADDLIKCAIGGIKVEEAPEKQIKFVTGISNLISRASGADKKHAKAKTISCTTCGKPISKIAQSNVTRFLSWESRCQCQEPGMPQAIQSPPATQDLSPEKALDEQFASLANNLPERYEALEVLGYGGMGIVFKVRDKELDKIFALKMLRPRLAKGESTGLEREAEASSRLTHANVAAFYQFGFGKNLSPYIVMDYIAGENLASILRREHVLNVPRAVDIFIQMAEAVEHAHTKDVLHKDIKPSNLILQPAAGGTEIAKLVDFGIANAINSPANPQEASETVGTPNYMSPEQIEGRPLDARSDIYSMGCLMYESLSGSVPFPGATPIQTVVKHLSETPEPMAQRSNIQPIAEDLEYIVQRCLAKDPSNRYASAEGLKKDLENFRQQRPVKKQVLSSGKAISAARRPLLRPLVVAKMLGWILWLIVEFSLTLGLVQVLEWLLLLEFRTMSDLLADWFQRCWLWLWWSNSVQILIVIWIAGRRYKKTLKTLRQQFLGTELESECELVTNSKLLNLAQRWRWQDVIRLSFIAWIAAGLLAIWAAQLHLSVEIFAHQFQVSRLLLALHFLATVALLAVPPQYLYVVDKIKGTVAKGWNVFGIQWFCKEKKLRRLPLSVCVIAEATGCQLETYNGNGTSLVLFDHCSHSAARSCAQQIGDYFDIPVNELVEPRLLYGAYGRADSIWEQEIDELRFSRKETGKLNQSWMPRDNGNIT